MLAEVCLAIFHKFLENLEAFCSQLERTPGYYIMELLGGSNNSDSLLAKLVCMLNTATVLNDKAGAGDWACYSEKVTLQILLLLQRALQHQSYFKDRYVHECPRFQLLSTLIMESNDTAVANIAGLMGHETVDENFSYKKLSTVQHIQMLSKHRSADDDDLMAEFDSEISFTAIWIFSFLARQDSAQCVSKVEVATHREEDKQKLWKKISLKIFSITSDSPNKTALSLVQLLLDNLDIPGFNVAKLLLGFEHKERFDRNDLKKSQRNFVLQALIGLTTERSFLSRFPSLGTAIYELFYKLSSSRVCHGPFLALMIHHGVFLKLLKDLPSPSHEFTEKPKELQKCILATGYLLKCVALELRASSTVESGNEVLKVLGFVPSDARPERGVCLVTKLLEDLHVPITPAPALLIPLKIVPSRYQIPQKDRSLPMLIDVNKLERELTLLQGEVTVHMKQNLTREATQVNDFHLLTHAIQQAFKGSQHSYFEVL